MADTVSAASSVYDAYQRPVPKASGELDKNAFLQILTAQLKYQDPMEGTDNSQFASQMAQFAALEQMTNLNTSFSAMMAKQDILTGSMWIGKDVMVMGFGDSEPISGKVQGFAIDSTFGLLLAVNGKEYTMDQVIAIKDPSEPWGHEVTPEVTPGEEENTSSTETEQTGDGDTTGDVDSGGSEQNGDI